MQAEKVLIKLSEIKFDEGVYPREAGHDPETVQKYANDIPLIEAAGKFISVNANNVLIDGKHRMLAYKKNADGADIEVTVFKYHVTSDLATINLACSLQDKGKSLSNQDRIHSAKIMYALGEQSQVEIAKALSVSPSTVSNWLSRTRKEEKEKKKAKAFDMWLACHTQEEIAAATEVAAGTVANFESEFLKNSTAEELRNWNDFEIPIYNVWKQQTKSNGVSHFGNSEQKWLENLLYFYTSPGDIVVDPFAGGASTIDVCKKRGRRYFVSDRKPIVEREHEIRKHDLIDESGNIQMPSVPRWKDVGLVYLDPPYWKQAEGQYSNDPTDLANMDLEQFNNSLSGIIKAFAGKLKSCGPAYIALIIQPTQWKSPNRSFTDHVGDMLRMVKLPVKMRYSVPYESQQCTAQMVTWSKENKTPLVLTREIIVWEVS